MTQLFPTILEEKVLAYSPDEDVGPLLAEFWNNREKYDIIWSEEGSIRRNEDTCNGDVIFANKYFRVLGKETPVSEQITRDDVHISSYSYHFIRDGSDLFTTLFIENKDM